MVKNNLDVWKILTPTVQDGEYHRVFWIVEKMSTKTHGKGSFKISNAQDYANLVYLTRYLSDDASISQRLWHIKNDHHSKVQCKECINLVKWYHTYGSYAECCSSKCHAKSLQISAIEQLDITNPSRSVIEFLTTNEDFTGIYKSKENRTLLQEILNLTMFLPEDSRFETRVHHILNRTYSIPKCKTCNVNGVLWSNKQTCYSDHCSTKCKNKDPDFIAKIAQTCQEKYGVTSYTASKDFQDKYEQHMMDTYGVPHYLQNEEKLKATQDLMEERYGYRSNFSTEDSQRKTRETNIRKRGVPYVSQDPECLKKQKRSAFHKLKEYKFPSGRIEHVQGYEPFALDYLINKECINEDDIIVDDEKTPRIEYLKENGKIGKYFPDIYIPSQNRLIEVKSTWTIRKEKENSILLKRDAAIVAGYKYDIMVMDAKGNVLQHDKYNY